MHVDVQIERRPKSLEDRHRPAATVRYALRAGAAPQEIAEHRPHEHPDDRTAQGMIPGQHIARAMRQRSAPIGAREPAETRDRPDAPRARPSAARSNWDTPPCPCRRTAADARGRSRRNGIARSPRRAGRSGLRPCSGRPEQSRRAQESAELVVDELRQAFAVAPRRRLRAKRLVVVAHHLVQDAIGGTPRPIRA